MCRCFSIPLFVLCVCVTAGFGTDDLPPEVAKATAAYDKARAAARNNLLKGFDTVADRIAKANIDAVERLKLLDALKAERERFEKHGLVPWSERMWQYTANYMSAPREEEAELRRVYGGLIDKALKAKKDDLANKLRADLATAIDAKVVARWEHTAFTKKKGNKGRVIEFLSNGRLDTPDSPATWTLDRTGKLQLRWPAPNAPGGAWVDSVQVSDDGTAYRGENQGRTPITGRYVRE